MTPETLEALAWQAKQMLSNVIVKLDLDVEPFVTGFVFRPADDDDLAEDENPANLENLWVFEAHGTLPDNDMNVENFSSKVSLGMPEGLTYPEALERIVHNIKTARVAKEQADG